MEQCIICKNLMAQTQLKLLIESMVIGQDMMPATLFLSKVHET